MTKQELIEYCLTYPSALVDYPFDETTAILKHSGNGKMFAAIDDVRLGKVYLSLKCKPMKADFLRSVYKSVETAWHFNKQHWNGIIVDDDVPQSELFEMINDSFDLTKPKVRKLKNETKTK